MKSGKKILSILLVAAVAFVAGFGGAKLGMQSNTQTSIDAFGQTVNIKSSAVQTGTSQNITINVSEDMTVAEAIAAKVMPSVVGFSTIYETTYSSSGVYDIWGLWGSGGSRSYTYEAESQGTGVVVDSAGYILTNSHVVNDGDYKSITISFYDGSELEGTVLWNDTTLDLAIVKVDATDLVAAELGDSDTLNIGSYAAVIGNPLGLQFERSMSQGIISGLNRTITVSSDGSSSTTMENLIQTDATINSGNSGGPLLNSKGQVVGINSAKASDGEGMGFAIPINTAKPIVEQIKSTGKFTRAYIGISGATLEDQGYTESQLEENFGTTKGIYVASVSENGGAAAAGIKKGDIIIGANGEEVTTMNKLNTLLVKLVPGDKVTLTVLRDGEEMEFVVTLTDGQVITN